MNYIKEVENIFGSITYYRVGKNCLGFGGVVGVVAGDGDGEE